MAFSDSSKPIATCAANDCNDCPVRTVVHCHFRPKELAHFLLIVFPCFLIGGAGVLTSGVWPLAVWIAITVGFFGLLEIRVMCSHCPHYAEEGSTLGCWANHGSPKLWKYRPGPMSALEKQLFIGGLAVVWGYPLPFLLFGEKWFFLALYILTSAGFFVTLKFFLCSQCMNFACPLNSVGDTARELFLQRNPSVAEHWKQAYPGLKMSEPNVGPEGEGEAS
ncbi:MAG: hypothetical protein GY774_00580 [Planctomycetes bacterium]|nr:hypothetical protein [Planctomycetota bacterium]